MIIISLFLFQELMSATSLKVHTLHSLCYILPPEAVLTLPLSHLGNGPKAPSSVRRP